MKAILDNIISQNIKEAPVLIPRIVKNTALNITINSTGKIKIAMKTPNAIDNIKRIIPQI